jgi:glycosyltransferase involved in cell wall biosynthesis
MKPNIVFIVGKLHSFAGSSNQALVLAESLAETVSNIFILNLEKDAHEDVYINGVLVKSLRRFGYIGYIKFFLSLEKNTIIHIQGYFLDFVLLCFAFRFKYIIKSTLYNSDDYLSLRASRFGYIKSFLLRRADANNALSPQIYRINERFCKSDRVFCIPNVVSFYNNITSYNQKKNRVIFVGGIVKRKRPHLAIKFFLEHFPIDYEFQLIGPSIETADYDADYFNYCKSLIGDRVSLIGKMSKDFIEEELSKSKFLLFFSENEGMPNVVLEAMSFNCIPIMTPMDGLAETLLPEELNHLIVNNFDKLEFDKIISSHEKVIRNNVLRDFVIENNHRDVVVAKTVAMYERVLSD